MGGDGCSNLLRSEAKRATMHLPALILIVFSLVSFCFLVVFLDRKRKREADGRRRAEESIAEADGRRRRRRTKEGRKVGSKKKWKRPLRKWFQVPVVKVIKAIKKTVKSSSRPLAEPEEYCNICMDPKFRHECFDIKGCSHYYCASCVGQYVEAKLEDNVTSIGCPDPSCKDGFLELEMCQSILKPEVFDRWGTALCESMIGAMKLYCPYKDCSALLMDEGGGEGGQPIIMADCPHCCRLFCAQCKVPWHVVSCEEYQKLGLDERGIEDIMLREMANKSQWQRCPKCKYYVERIDGCRFMKCRCGHQFCYGCATTMTIDHYCRKCKR